METLYIENIIGKRLYQDQGKQDIRTLIVSSHQLVSKGLSGLLDNKPNIKLLEHASNKLEMILRIQESSPSLIIIYDDGVNAGSSNTLETISLATQEFPNIRILLIIKNHDFNKELFVLKMGVRGILIDNVEQSTLMDCITTLANGGLWIRRRVMEKFITEQLFIDMYSRKNAPRLPSFTKRELEIIQLVSNGQKNKEIGEQLFITEKTVKHHLTRVFRKLNISKRVQLKGIV